MTTILRRLGAAATLAVATACGGPPPPVEPMTVHSDPQGATCTASRDGQPVGETFTTPAPIPVGRARTDVVVTCRRDGYLDTVEEVSPFFEGNAMGAAFVFGGALAAMASATSSANFAYPKWTMVQLTPAAFGTATERDAFYGARRARLEERHKKLIAAARDRCQPNEQDRCDPAVAEATKRRDAAVAALEDQRRAARIGS